MKKFTAMLGLLAVGVGSMMATPVNTGVRNDLKVVGVTEKFHKMQKDMKAGISNGEILYTRTYEDRSKNVWNIKAQLAPETLNEMLMLQDANGNPYHPSFDQLPYYCLDYTITKTKPGDDNYSTAVIFHLAWPSQYIYSQVWTYEGDVDAEGMIPVDLREYDAVTLDELCNTPERCSLFRECDAIGAGAPVDGKWSYFTMLNNQQIGEPCLYDDKAAYTKLDENTYSTLDFTMFDSDENWLEVTNRIFLVPEGTTTTRRVQCEYKGVAEIEGFYEFTQTLPEFGDMHLFNTGVISSESMGDNNPFPSDFGALTALYFVVGDKHILWQVDPTATKFDKKMITNGGIDLPEGTPVRDHANYNMGYLFAPATYGNDQTLNPENVSFECLNVEREVIGDNMWIANVTPSEWGYVPYPVGDMNNNVEAWSENYGFRVLVNNMADMANVPSTFGWGYDRGLVSSVRNYYGKTIHAESKGKLFYHYDPKDMKLFRELSLVGNREYNSVENIAAENATVAVENGAIVVSASENADVAVYSLDGVCVKNARAAAGESVRVEVAKGIYVVTVNGASTKVAL